MNQPTVFNNQFWCSRYNRYVQLSQNKYALKPYFDNGSMLSRKLELLQVPIKIFIEDGIIKQTWINASFTSEKQTEFKKWLQSVKFKETE